MNAGAGGMAMKGLDVEPAPEQKITVTATQQSPTVAYQATLDGKPIKVAWALDRGDIGTIPAGPSEQATFTPSGNVGGLVTVQAGLNGKTVSRQILVGLTATQNGANANNASESAQIANMVSDLTQGGGIGGVGGEGLGQAVTDMSTLSALTTPTDDGTAEGLAFLYPYDQTVWPRGLPAPLLQWTSSLGDADAIQIDITTTSGAFTYSGTFARPQILSQTGGAFVRHPIPQDIWDMATNSAGGSDKVTVKLTVAYQGKGYGPISETWTVAKARLDGIIYYNSYGTQLAQNYGGAVGGNHMFGGAVLSIHVGDTGPQLVAGSSGGVAQCRVCHSVAANGSVLTVQHGDNYGTTSAYALSNMGTTENVLAHDATFPGIYPDGSMALTEQGTLLPIPSDATPIATTGLPGSDLGTPAFSPDGTKMVFNSGQQLTVMAFDSTTFTFSGAQLVSDDTGQPTDTRPGWPAFFPDGSSVIFEHQIQAGSDGNGGSLYTRKGAKGQIYWTSTNSPSDVTPLDNLNGKGYLPKLASPINMTCTADGVQVGGMDADHGDDVDLSYEPTVNPIASGGYAWVVFTSRRMYGSVANIPPFCSDPRGVDLIQNITPKKLWVAAIDLTAAPGTDSSHPAFYLPAQEILAGNSRAFWVLDPCKPDGDTCMSGDQCCNGYCEPNGMNGELVCSDTPPNTNCSNTGDKCTTSSDCCNATDECINGFCAMKGIN